MNLFRLMIVLALALTLAACSDSAKKIVDEEPGTDDIVTDDTVTDNGTTDNTVTDNGTTDQIITDGDSIVTDDVQNDEVVTDDVITDEENPDDDGIIGPDTPQPDTDVVVGTCTGGAYHLLSYVYYQDGQSRIVGGGSIAYDPVGANDSEGVPACYQPGTTVNMVLTVDADYEFDQWRGVNGNEVTGTFPNFAILMDGDKEARARVASTVIVNDEDTIIIPEGEGTMPDTDVVVETCTSGFKLIATVAYREGNQNIPGGGSIAFNPTGADSSLGNPVCYTANATVTMTVTVDSGYTWDSWRGMDRNDVTGTFPTFTIDMDADKSVRAQVVPNP